MTVHEFTVTERPGERTTAKPHGLRVHLTRDYTAHLIARLTEQLADENNTEVQAVMFGEMD